MTPNLALILGNQDVVLQAGQCRVSEEFLAPIDAFGGPDALALVRLPARWISLQATRFRRRGGCRQPRRFLGENLLDHRRIFDAGDAVQVPVTVH